ncbi:uncharacterized protein CTRU02_207624 [Colletotrichum truncatum]|uniref:Uncharacterized protein n=1 Tax=Colletotrichum truncatum TaxID=5467 RepID=A0ACC3Z1C2_COLTU|nr:uncharacterized protein CTRU02_09273 [Colletotrichum truncatum]KAF6788952.1 hypothetical protein CTRU02_09273 [Colletotrichum truncatum]
MQPPLARHSRPVPQFYLRFLVPKLHGGPWKKEAKPAWPDQDHHFGSRTSCQRTPILVSLPPDNLVLARTCLCQLGLSRIGCILIRWWASKNGD